MIGGDHIQFNVSGTENQQKTRNIQAENELHGLTQWRNWNPREKGTSTGWSKNRTGPWNSASCYVTQGKKVESRTIWQERLSQLSRQTWAPPSSTEMCDCKLFYGFNGFQNCTIPLRQSQSSTRTCPAGRMAFNLEGPASLPKRRLPMSLTLLSRWMRWAIVFTNSSPAFDFLVDPTAALLYCKHASPKYYMGTPHYLIWFLISPCESNQQKLRLAQENVELEDNTKRLYLVPEVN